MSYRRMTDGGDVEGALDNWKQTLLATSGAQTAMPSVGFQGESRRREVIWLRKHHIWTHIGSWLNLKNNRTRTWTAYGCVNDWLPDSVGITVEINPRILSGFTMRFPDPCKTTRGVILVDDDQPNRMLLAHAGGTGGSHPISAEVFLERIKDIKQVIDIKGKAWFLLGDIEEPNTVATVAKYVHQVDGLKRELSRRS